jgi:LysR family transcriptional regulator, hca operon transcriptional activator
MRDLGYEVGVELLKRSARGVEPNQAGRAFQVDNLAMAMSLVASTRGVALLPAYAQNFLPWSVISRPIRGQPPTIDLVVGYSKSNTSPLLKFFL